MSPLPRGGPRPQAGTSSNLVHAATFLPPAAFFPVCRDWTPPQVNASGSPPAGNISFIKTHFPGAPALRLAAARVLRDGQTGRGRGFGFVIFANGTATAPSQSVLLHLSLKKSKASIDGKIDYILYNFLAFFCSRILVPLVARYFYHWICHVTRFGGGGGRV